LVAAEFPQPFRDKGRRLVQIEADFRRLVDLPSPGGDFVLHLGGSVENWH
jgi:hypothetical protein